MPGFMEEYQNLPGMLVEFKDGGYVLRNDPNPPDTGSMLILGTSIDGPTLDPIAVDGSTAELIFGSDVNLNGVPNGSTLIPAFKQAWDSGCRDIRLMRITGKPATATLSGLTAANKVPLKVTENQGQILGNDSTPITLAKTPLVNTVQVVAKNTVLASSAFTVAAQIVTIKPNVTDAGENLQISYDYTGNVDTAESLQVTKPSSSFIITLSRTPSTAVVVKHGADTLALTTDYTVSGNTITLVKTSYPTTGTIAINDIIDVSYSYSATLHATESGTASAPFVTATSNQTITLNNTPIADTVHLYVDGLEALNSNSFVVNYATKKVDIKKEYFAKDSLISVSYLYLDPSNVTSTVKLQSSFSGVLYNDSSYIVKNIYNSDGSTVIGKEIIITKPSSIASSTEPSLSYKSTDFPTFLNLINAINTDTHNGVFKASTDFETALTSDLTETSGKFTQGEDGINVTKQELFNALSGVRNPDGTLSQFGAYQILEDYQVDCVVPTGVYADDEEALSGNYQNFAYELALFCAVVSYRNRTCFGVIAMKPNKDTSLLGVKNYANRLATYNNNYIMRDYNGKPLSDQDGNYIDLGKYITVVGGPDPQVWDKNIGMYYGNQAVMYAAMDSVLPSNSATTNKKLPGAKGLKYRFSNQQLDAITANRIVTFKIKSDKAGVNTDVYVVDGVTAALKGSAYGRRTTGKTLKEVIDQIREVADPYIGEANTVEQKNALAAAISKRLSILKEKEYIQDYSFQIVANILDQLLGQAKIELTIVPPQEFRKITTVVSLKPSL